MVQGGRKAKEMKLGPRLKGLLWSAEEDVRLKSLIEANTSIDLIAAKLKRSVPAHKVPCGSYCTYR